VIAPAPPRSPILMVDDHVENLLALEAVLGPLGQQLVRATSGREALREVLRHDFAVILMDVQMPEMNGFETALLIKERPRSRDIPIIFLTAISKDEEFVFEGYSAGAVDYIFKPFNPAILRSKVQVFVDLYLQRRELQRQGELLRASELREVELRHRVGMREVENRHALIVESAMDSIITFDDDHRVRFLNGAAERTFRIPASTAFGMRIFDLMPRGLLDEGGSVETRRGATVPTRTGVGLRSDGEQFDVEFTLSAVRLQGRVEHTLILRDISERLRTEALLEARTTSLSDTLEELRALNEQLSERTRELETALGVRNRFYASMSHELRTPINAILGYTSLLLDGIYGEVSPEQRASAERTMRAARHLMDLVNDILDLSKVEAGKMEIKVELVSFPEIFHELMATVAPLAESYGVELKLDTCHDSTISDARRIRQILLNLLSNAIKFGNSKPVEVSCGRAPDGRFVIAVQDHGAGIAEADQERIFEEFVQLENEERPGTGLGLSISRRFAELLGGELTVTSTPGEGSTFRLILPAEGLTDESATELAGLGASG
jgi:PAS domain S-box-containing protein